VTGETFGLTITVWNGGRTPVLLRAFEPLLPRGWSFVKQAAANGDVAERDTVLAPNDVTRRTFRVSVPADATPTEAYFLRTPRDGAMYRWNVADSLRALPFGPPPVRALIAYDAGADVIVEREAQFVDVDKAIGEVRRPLIIVPPVSLSVAPAVAAMPQGDDRARPVTVTVTSAASSGVSGTLRLNAPAGWRVEPEQLALQLTPANDTRSIVFAVTPPSSAASRETLRAEFAASGATYDRGYTIIQYPHIDPQPLYRAAEVRFTRVAVTVPQNLHVGYIEGAGDDGADALRQLGVRVDLLDATMLASGDLSRYDAIVAGIRAYEVRPDVVAHNARLLEYARNGGTFIVQYNKYELVDGGFMPFPATMSRPHGRVTDENAAVTLLEQSHPLLTFPNRITAADFEGWVQERGLYYLNEWDERYSPLLSMADPGEAAQRGSLVAARVGQGWYVYTGLALFRQLPEGVPGAYRLLVNLVSLGRLRAAGS
jgi:hypothetical protein